MKLRMFSVVLLFTLLIITVSGTATLQSPEMVDAKSIAGYATNEYMPDYGYGEGIGVFSESNDYTEIWYEDNTLWRVGDSLAIYMIMMVQLPDVSKFDNIVFHADWRFLTSVTPESCVWALGNSTGDIVAEHNNIYSVNTIDTGYEYREVTLDIDADVITAQNSTGFLSFIITAAGGNSYDIYCDWAFLSLEYDYDFSQTVEGDTYLTPDPTQFLTVYGYGEGIGAFSESNSYNETWSNDATVWRVGDDLAIYMIMMVQLPDVSKFDNIVFHADWRFLSDVSDTCYWALGDYNGDLVAAHNNLYSVTTTDTGYEEVEISLAIDADVITAQNSTGFLSFIITAAGPNDYDIYCDWAFLSLERDYVESFSDASDWNDHANFAHASDTFSSDGDILTKSNNWGGSTDYDFIICDTPSIDTSSGDWYLEVYTKCTNLDASYFYVRSADGDSGGDAQSFSTSENSDWMSYKWIITLDVVENIQIAAWDNDGDSVQYVDYIRIGRSNEFGFNHDGSTTDGVSTSGGGTTSTDSDYISLIDDGDGSVFQFYIDTTVTNSKLEPDYYPFLELQFHTGDAGDVFKLNSYDGSAFATVQAYTSISATGLYRWNLDAIEDEDTLYFELTTYAGQTLRVDYLSAYGIANYTLTQSSTTADDYLYVSGGILYSNMDSGEIVLDHHPTFLLNGSYSWNKSTSLGDSYLSFYHGGWKAYSGATTGNLIGGTTTDYRIMFNDTANIIDIQYTAIPPQWHSFTCEDIEVDMPNWHNFTAEEIIVFVIIGEFTVQYWLMLLGFILIPASTIFLVKGGRDEMSINKFLIFLLTFFIGWGLLLGGIYG